MSGDLWETSTKQQLVERLKCIDELLTLAYDINNPDLYLPQGVNQAHRVAAGGIMPSRVKLDEKESKD